MFFCFFCFFISLSRPENEEWVLSTTTYGGKAGDPSEHFISSVQKGNVTACQFHPEKSGKVGWFSGWFSLRTDQGSEFI